jgi:adenylate kinase family enzyme
MKHPKKIFILGTIGSGKSTLAKQVSEKLKIKHYDLDDVFWTRKFNEKRREKDRDKKFRKLCDKRKWIIEGVYSTWIEYGIKKAEMVLLLKIPKRSLWWRITKRTLKKEKSKRFGEKRYKENFKDYLGLLKAANKYYKKKFTRGYYRHKELIDKHKVEFIILKNNKQVNEFIEGLR